MAKRKKKKRVYNLDRRIIAALRRVFFYGPLRTGAAKTAKTDGGYKCNECGTISDRAIIDHIQPVVNPKTGFSGWSNYIKRLFCPAKGLQNLCKACHDAKSLTERRIREVVKRGGKA